MEETEKKKIVVMVIEDEEMLLQAISRKLVSSGLKPITCMTVARALEYLRSDEPLPDVIWLDYYLPDMNGIEFMNEVKKNDKWSKIPVIVVSNSASDQKKNSMLALGVKKYILKAKYRLDDIIKMIEEIVAMELA